MDTLFNYPYWEYLVISLFIIGSIYLMKLGLDYLNPPDERLDAVLVRRQKEEKQKIIKQMFMERKDQEEPETSSLGFSDLTVADIFILFKDFAFYCFFVLLIFGIPYLLFTLGFGFAESLVPQEDRSWFNWLVAIGILAILAVSVFQDPAYTLAWFSVLLRDLSKAMSRLTRNKQILLLAALLGYFCLAVTYPKIWFILSLVLMPFEFVYGKYRSILRRKSEAHSIST